MSKRHPRGCGYCDHPLFCAIKCPSCGKVFDDDEQPTEPTKAEQDDPMTCIKCGQPTHHVGNTCYSCDHPETAPQGTDEKTSGELASGECLPAGAAPLPDDVADMVERLQAAMATDVGQIKAADMLERLARDRDEHKRCAGHRFDELLEAKSRIAELEAQREGMVLVPMETTEEIREVIRNEHGAYGSEDELYSALIAAATKVKP